MSNVKHVEQADFKSQVLESEIPVLVDFWATWCGPCKAIAPLLDELSVQNSDIKVVKVDVDKNQELAAKYGIRGIPTMVLFINGEPEATKVGSVNKTALNSFIETNI